MFIYSTTTTMNILLLPKPTNSIHCHHTAPTIATNTNHPYITTVITNTTIDPILPPLTHRHELQNTNHQCLRKLRWASGTYLAATHHPGHCQHSWWLHSLHHKKYSSKIQKKKKIQATEHKRRGKKEKGIEYEREEDWWEKGEEEQGDGREGEM